jgi:hypothetical protein
MKTMNTTPLALLLITPMLALSGCGFGMETSSSFASRNGAFNEYAQHMDKIPVGVSYSEDLLQSFQAQTGAAASNRTMTAFRNEITKVPEAGKADGVTAPMWNAITNLAGESCQDLVEKERDGGKRVFQMIDLKNNTVAISKEAKENAIRGMARSFWGRNESESERSMIREALDEAFPQTTTTAQKERAMLYACTAMLAALDAHKR